MFYTDYYYSMKWSQVLIPTLRENPKEAEMLSHRLLLRGGYIRPLASGIYNLLPIGWKVMSQIAGVIREEMDRIGAQEFFLSALSPREIWEKTGRWYDYGELMFRLKDRKDRGYALSPTHEEIVTIIAAQAIRSYRQLPQIWYQIQRKYRDELRPRGGLVRIREFLMKDSYSFDRDEDGLDRAFSLHRETYQRIFDRCRINYYLVEASGGVMGEGASEEFLAPSSSGEDFAVICNCGYKANMEVARSAPAPETFPDTKLKKVHTPDKKTVEEVSSFLGVKKTRLVKTMIYLSNDKPIALLIRGDRELNEEKLHRRFGFNFRPATGDEILNILGVPAGFIGPVKLDLEVYCDDELKGGKGLITGANEVDYHVLGLNINRDVRVKEYLDLRRVSPGDCCIRCGQVLKVEPAMELGHIFKLGTKYSGPLGATFVDSDGRERPVIMGSYGVGLGRVMACLCEQTADDEGPNWPIALAPYDVSIITINTGDEKQMDISAEVYRSCLEAGFSIIWDERDEAPGVKFKDHDLVGIPIRIIVGPEGMKVDKIDVKVKLLNRRIFARTDELLDILKGFMEELSQR
ncbi:MAG TPA: proline--tRNA ligase [bacterium (Candidatus Stahlbacteria)]|nr:proline--tRNA ligase [Candidatus Stahlbacteria bacterium]